MSKQNMIDQASSAQAHLPSHTSSTIRHHILKQEKDHQEKNEIPSLLQNNMIYISTSIHFKSGVIWVSKQRSPSHAPHPQPQVESWQVISHAPTVLLRICYIMVPIQSFPLPWPIFFSSFRCEPWGQLHLLCSAGSPECRWLPAKHFGASLGRPSA